MTAVSKGIVTGILVLVAIAGCGGKKKEGATTSSSSAPVANHPPLSPMLAKGECSADTDCELTDLDAHTCCPLCTRRGVTHAAATALRTACTSTPPTCPKNACEYRAYSAKCVSGKCAAFLD